MKHLILALLLCLSIAPFHSQAASDQPDIRTVTATLERLHKVLVAPDSQGLLDLTDVGLTYGHSSGAIEDRAAFISNLTGGKTTYVTVSFNDPHIVVRRNVAWIRGDMKAQVRDSAGKSDLLELKVLYVFLKQGGHWKLLARQAVRTPSTDRPK